MIAADLFPQTARTLALLLALGAGSALAQTQQMPQGNDQNSNGGSQRGRMQGPPPEAIQACAGKSAQTACSFTDPRGHTMSGICDAPPAQGSSPQRELACCPPRGQRDNGGGMQGGKGNDMPPPDGPPQSQ